MIVETAAGKVEGLEREGVLLFRGIPYAYADRFRPPQPAPPWAGVLDATRFGPSAPQDPSATDTLFGVEDQDFGEDCLVLNVCTPAADDAARPVMVWIHGGGYTSGSGRAPYYDAGRLAVEGDVVVVTINYRLGLLGFLYLDHLVGDFAGSGVNGIRDQIEALRWVRDNIAAFGGDPRRVTVFGESAGAMSIGTLLGAPEARGLFHAAVLQSGAAEHVQSPERATTVTDHVLRHLGLGPGEVDRLLDLPVDALLAAQAAAIEAVATARPDPRRPGSGYLHLPFEPVVDGGLLTRPPLEAVRDGSAAGVPLLVGTTRDEWNLFALQDTLADIGPERLRRRVARLFGEDRADEAIALYQAAYPDKHSSRLWCAMLTDRVFRMPAIRLAEAQLAHTDQVSMYRFDYASTALGGLAGACHAIDIPFVFDTVEQEGVKVLLGGVDDGTRALARTCTTAWAAMARTGRPAHDGLDWPLYDSTRRATCVLDRDITVIDDPDGDIRAFWSSEETG
ncbi:MAG TPA: carboxylesterase/lipase family protein [Acidimicrobiales bacterium]